MHPVAKTISIMKKILNLLGISALVYIAIWLVFLTIVFVTL